jgi:mRNA interferase RelE/StbE
MSKYEVRLKKSAQKDLGVLPKITFKKVIKQLKALEDNPRPKGCKKLAGYVIFIGESE